MVVRLAILLTGLPRDLSIGTVPRVKISASLRNRFVAAVLGGRDEHLYDVGAVLFSLVFE